MHKVFHHPSIPSNYLTFQIIPTVVVESEVVEDVVVVVEEQDAAEEQDAQGIPSSINTK
jgi:hypothetical protein